MPKYEPNTFRTYSPEDVQKLQGSFNIDYTLARLGANRLWELFNTQPFLRSLGCLDGNQAIEMVQAGASTLYCSGWQTAAEQMLPDMALYSSDSVPNIVRKLNNALLAADRIECASGGAKRYWLAPIIADMDNGFGNVKNTYLLMKNMIESGASACHLEDQAEKKCGHMGGKSLIPTKTFVKRLIAARLAADVCNVPTVLIARTDANSAAYINSDCDELDHPFIDFDKRTDDGFYAVKGDRIERCVVRGLSFAKHADVLWMETDKPDLSEAHAFATAIHSVYPNKLLAYNCSPSFNWRKNLSDDKIAEFQNKLGEMGFKYQFITLASFHSNNLSSYKLAHDYQDRGMSAFVDIQEESLFLQATRGYTAVKHQAFVGTGYWDTIQQVIDGHDSSSALKGSTEHHQF